MSAQSRHKVRAVSSIGCADARGGRGDRVAGDFGYGRRDRLTRRSKRGNVRLQLAAQYASSEILKEINRRFDILNQLASDADLRQQLVRIKDKPKDEALWKRLDDWLGARKADHAKDAASDSWFINDSRGVQVARSPRSEASARRELLRTAIIFHGQGTNLPPDTKNVKPIKAPHVSAVYRSTSNRPFEGCVFGADRKRQEGKRARGDRRAGDVGRLGEFNVLEKKLPKGHEVVLIDMRESAIDGPPRRGLFCTINRKSLWQRRTAALDWPRSFGANR